MNTGVWVSPQELQRYGEHGNVHKIARGSDNINKLRSHQHFPTALLTTCKEKAAASFLKPFYDEDATARTTRNNKTKTADGAKNKRASKTECINLIDFYLSRFGATLKIKSKRYIDVPLPHHAERHPH